MSRTLALLTAIASALWLSDRRGARAGGNRRPVASSTSASPRPFRSPRAAARKSKDWPCRLRQQRGFRPCRASTAPSTCRSLVFDVSSTAARRASKSTSSQIAREPFVSFLLEVQGRRRAPAARVHRAARSAAAGRDRDAAPASARMLCPERAAAAGAAADARPPSSTRPPTRPRARGDTDAGAAAGAAAGAGVLAAEPARAGPGVGPASTEGDLRPGATGETFWSIATRLRPDSARSRWTRCCWRSTTPTRRVRRRQHQRPAQGRDAERALGSRRSPRPTRPRPRRAWARCAASRRRRPRPAATPLRRSRRPKSRQRPRQARSLPSTG